MTAHGGFRFKRPQTQIAKLLRSMESLRSLFRSATLIAGIVMLRFAPISRVWATLVIAVNAVAIAFVHTIYGQVALISVGVGIIVMAWIQARLGFVRLLGIGHFLWIPMLPWLALELQNLESNTWLYRWLLCLLVINSICLLIDAVDVTRFLAGDRNPHYTWNRDGATVQRK